MARSGTTERFFAKVEQPANGASCWPWRAAHSTDGYGHFFYEGAVTYAHRASWAMFRGEIPDDLCVLHKCDNPSCVNPAHLFLGTKLENNLDKMQKGRHTWASKTHCIRDHPLSGDNLYVGPNGLRACRECKRLRERANHRIRHPNARPERARRSDCGAAPVAA